MTIQRKRFKIPLEIKKIFHLSLERKWNYIFGSVYNPSDMVGWGQGGRFLRYISSFKVSLHTQHFPRALGIYIFQGFLRKGRNGPIPLPFVNQF